MNSIIYLNGMNDAESKLFLANSVKKLFIIEKRGNQNEYWSKVYMDVFPKLRELEKRLGKKNSGIQERLIPNDIRPAEPNDEE